MSFTKNDIAKLAHLSRLAIYETATDNKPDTLAQSFVDSIADDLGNILKLIEKISAVDTTNIAPMSHPYPMRQHVRSDVITEPNVVAAMQAIAPKDGAMDNLYIVPLVVE